MTKEPVLLFGKLGWTLLVTSILLILGIACFLPNILAIAELNMPEKWPLATRIIVQITVGSWSATSVISIARVIVWLRSMFAITTITQYEEERKVVILIHDFNLWLLGIMTALAVYMTQWFSGGK